MAFSPEARRLTEAHRLAQARLGAQTVAQMLDVWPLLDPGDIDGSRERWLSAAVPIVQRQRVTSARLAGNYLALFRRLELDTSDRFTPTLVEDEPSGSIALSLIVTGPAAVKRHMTINPITARAMDVGRTMSAGSAMRHALNAGRETLVESVKADGRALGWARATSGSPCSFCAMLAGRGPVYRDSTGGFDAHDHCACSAEPVYRDDAPWPAGADRWRDLWDETTAGLSGADARNAFRQALAPT